MTGWDQHLQIEKFIDVMDRYQELAALYWQRLLAARQQTGTTPNQRLDSLLEVLQNARPARTKQTLTSLSPDQAQGQTVVPTSEVLEQTRRYQSAVLDRFRDQFAGESVAQVRKTLRLPPEDFLSRWGSISYAWDILTELASISVIPADETMVSRDLLYMLCVELEGHLRRVLIAEQLASHGMVTLGGSWDIEELRSLEGPDRLERLLERSLSASGSKLVTHAIEHLGPSIASGSGYDEDTERVVEIFAAKATGFERLLLDGMSIADTLEDCTVLTRFGLRIGYEIWHRKCGTDSQALSVLHRNMLFCTRKLLDQKRWESARDVADTAWALIAHDNLHKAPGAPSQGSAMIFANRLLSMKNLGIDVTTEVEGWNIHGLHPRYQLLQQVLLNRFAEAYEIALVLLQPEPATGQPNMCLPEFREWPALEEFRQSEYWPKLEKPR